MYPKHHHLKREMDQESFDVQSVNASKKNKISLKKYATVLTTMGGHH